MQCKICEGELEPWNADLGVCAPPEELEKRVKALPEPLRGTMLRVGRDFGIVANSDAST